MQMLINNQSELCEDYGWCNYEAVDQTSIIM